MDAIITAVILISLVRLLTRVAREATLVLDRISIA